MKNKLFTFLIIFFLFIFKLTGQDIEFTCDSTFMYYRQNWWLNKETNRIYDSINRIDFSKVDFELRFWLHSVNQTGIKYNVFIMKHFLENNIWKAFYYEGFIKDNKTRKMIHKTMNEFFSNTELIKYNSKRLEGIWDSLVAMNILTLTLKQHPKKSISKTSKNGEEIREECIEKIEDCFSNNVIELIKKNCKRRYGFDFCKYDRFKYLKEFSQFKHIIDYLNKTVKTK